MERLPAIPQAEAQLGARRGEITLADVKALPGSSATEDQYLEFKGADSAGRPPIDKVVKTIAAFANADGGIVVVGVAEAMVARSTSSRWPTSTRRSRLFVTPATGN